MLPSSAGIVTAAMAVIQSKRLNPGALTGRHFIFGENTSREMGKRFWGRLGSDLYGPKDRTYVSGPFVLWHGSHFFFANHDSPCYLRPNGQHNE
jgi:hypothetical protein